MITAHLISSTSNSGEVPLNLAEERALGRLIAAAVVNKRFCDLLLEDPPEAICQGYYGEEFGLSDRAQSLVLSIQASTLAEFASAVDQARYPSPVQTGSLSFGRMPDTYYTSAEALVHQ